MRKNVLVEGGCHRRIVTLLLLRSTLELLAESTLMCSSRAKSEAPWAGNRSGLSPRLNGPGPLLQAAAFAVVLMWVPAVSGAAIRGVFASSRCAIAMGVDEAITVWTWGERGPGHTDGDGLPIPAHGGEAIAGGPLVLKGSDSLGRAPLPDSKAAAERAGLHRVAVSRFGVSDPGGLAVFERTASMAEPHRLSVVASGVGLELLSVALRCA